MSDLRYRYLQTSVDRGVLILTVSPSRLEACEMPQMLKDDMLGAVALAGADKVVIDLEHVEFLTSANLRPFLALRKTLQEIHGETVLCSLIPEILEIFEVTRLVRTIGSTTVIFETQPDLASAVAYLLRGKEALTANT